MLKQLFQLSDEDYLLDVFIKLQNKGLRHSIIVRTLGALFLALWMFIFTPSNREFFYFLALVSVFIGIGLVYFIISDSAYYRQWHAYVLYIADVFVVSFAVLYRPELGLLGLNSFDMGQSFLPYLFLLALSFISCNPALIAWMLLLTLCSWGLFIPIFLQGSFADMPWIIWSQYLFTLIAVAGTGIWMLRYLYQTMVQQVQIEREFYDVLIQDRQPDEDDEGYTDILTGFGTRAAFDRDSTQFTKVFSEGRLTDLTIAFIHLQNIDAFRAEAGEEAYHQLIRDFAKLARKQFRAADMLYYFSNDQFALLAPGASINNAERLRGLLSEILAHLHEQGYPNIDAEMGISTLDEVQRKEAAAA